MGDRIGVEQMTAEVRIQVHFTI